MRQVLALVPAYQAGHSIAEVVTALMQTAAFGAGVLVVDDGSTDGTFEAAQAAGAEVLRHGSNRGKGAALVTGLSHAHDSRIPMVVSMDADGQHLAVEAARLAQSEADPNALVLGTRDLQAAGAPLPNRFSNAVSNAFLSLFTGLCLKDTQCGLRRYPVAETLALGARGQRFEFEAEVVLRAARRRIPIVQVPVQVVYPQGTERQTHFDSVRDPWRIVWRVLQTLAEERRAP